MWNTSVRGVSVLTLFPTDLHPQHQAPSNMDNSSSGLAQTFLSAETTRKGPRDRGARVPEDICTSNIILNQVPSSARFRRGFKALRSVPKWDRP